MVKNSVILSLYLLLAFLYYLVGQLIRVPIFGIVLLISLYVSLRKEYRTNSYSILKVNPVVFFTSLVIFLLTLVIGIANGTLSPFVLYILSAPLMGHFLYSSKFDTKVLLVSFYFICTYMLIYFFKNRNLEHVFHQMSSNYVSVVILMNLIVIYLIKYRQREKIIYFPVIIGLVLSILSIGRSGILTTLGVLLVILFVKWLKFGFKKKLLIMLAFLIPILLGIAIYWESLMVVLQNIAFFEKFINGGVESNSRGIIINEYLSNLNSLTVLSGYNFYDNFWFKHYGLNPHNSFIRLHHFTGINFFIIITIIFIAMIRLIRRHLFVAGLLFAMLLRAVTDSTLFLTIYDFILISLLYVAFFDKNKYTIR